MLGVGAGLLGLSAVHAHDRFTWVLEVAPILLGVPVLIATYHRLAQGSLPR